MDVKESIQLRRSYRALSSVKITNEIINSLSQAAQLMCSCFNNQPWRFVFVYDENQLTKLKEDGLNPGNFWAHSSSMIIAVFSKSDLDCEIKDRKYYAFDTGLAVGSMCLQATEMGFVLHPIAGYDQEKVMKILNIPEDFQVLALLIFGKKSEIIPDSFKDYQVKAEQKRPPRKQFGEFAFHNKYKVEN